MINQKILSLTAVFAMSALLCSAADDGEKARKETPPSVPPVGNFFSTNIPAAQQKSSPFSTEISADFVKKVMETSARIEESKKQIAERQAYLYESNPQLKAYRKQMIEMQTRINKIIETDQELADMRLNRDITWTIMPVMPKAREQQLRMGPRLPGIK